jgi:hypothetical protein
MDFQVQTPGKRTRKLIRAATLVSFDAEGKATPKALFDATPRRRRGSKRLRPLEKALRRLGRAQAEAGALYLERHDASNERKKNGWLKDLGKNVRKAQRRGLKALKIRLP